MSWFSLALVLLRIADNIINWLREKQAMDAGADEEIAKASAAILAKTDAAKKIMQEVTGMTDEQVDKALKELEP